MLRMMQAPSRDHAVTRAAEYAATVSSHSFTIQILRRPAPDIWIVRIRGSLYRSVAQYQAVQKANDPARLRPLPLVSGKEA